MNRLLQNKKVAIIGGGPAGLMLARLLKMQDVHVHVYERDMHEHARAKGATLDLHEESGLAALKAVGLMDAFRAAYRPGAEKLRLVDEQGRIHIDNHEQGEEEISRPEIDHGPLLKILRTSLLPGTIIWNSQLTACLEKDVVWEMRFANGNVAEASFIIAADGANSKLRPVVTALQPDYSGITVLEGTVMDAANTSPAISALLKGGKIFALQGGRSVIVSSKGDGSYVFYTGCYLPEDWIKTSGINFGSRAQVLDWFKREYMGWAEVWQEMFTAAAVPFTPRPQYCVPLNQHWNGKSNITLMGDAAHLMSPYAGEGVNMAMQDALELSRALSDTAHPDLQSAIVAYEKEMLARTSAMASMTMEATRQLHSKAAMTWTKQIIQPSL